VEHSGRPMTEAELRRMWLEATPDSIGADVARVRALVDSTPPEEQEVVRFYLASLERLEHWLRDR